MSEPKEYHSETRVASFSLRPESERNMILRDLGERLAYQVGRAVVGEALTSGPQVMQVLTKHWIDKYDDTATFRMTVTMQDVQGFLTSFVKRTQPFRAPVPTERYAGSNIGERALPERSES